MTTSFYHIPIRLVSPNQTNSEHWSKSSKRNKIHKMLVTAYLKKGNQPKTIPCTVKLVRYSPKQFDRHDNLRMAFKWIVDAIAEYLTGCKTAGRGDDDTRIEWQYASEKTKGELHYITVIITPSEANKPDSISPSENQSHSVDPSPALQEIPVAQKASS